MARGYWDRNWSWMRTCRDCKSGPKAKFCCRVCGHVCKAPWDYHPCCPQGHGALVCMGDKWRPLKKKHWKVNAAAAQERFEYLRRMREIWI